MRLGSVLVLSFLAVAGLVGIVGRIYGLTTARAQQDLEDLQQSAVASVVSATELRFALQASQLEAARLIAARYREQIDASHDSEWNVAGDIDLEDIEDSLDAFESELAVGWRTVEKAREIAGRRAGLGTVESQIADLSAALREVEKEFGVYRDKVDRFVHLARYHPSDQVREFVDDELNPHYRDTMLAVIRDYENRTKRDLEAEVERIGASLVAANRRNRLFAGIALLSAAVLGLVITRWITRPIASLRRAALEVGRGQLEKPVVVQAGSELGLLAGAFNQMTEDLRQSTVSRSHLDKILQSMQDMLLVVDPERAIRTANRLALETLGYGAGDLLGRRVDELIAPEGGQLPAAASSGGTGEVELVAADGVAFPASFSSATLTSEDGEIEGQVFVLRDIRQRKQAEEALRRSLAEKEALLQEVHHRVKNNLQIVSSLLRLQGQDSSDGETARRFRESQNRIRSMALIHEQLYRSDDLARIDFSVYLKQLLDHLIGSYGGADKTIQTVLEVDPTPLDIDYAIPCGLIVNELVANSIEHGFPDGRGTISVRFSVLGGIHRLELRDDGVGISAAVEAASSTSLGLRLIDALTTQLGGEYELTGDDGTRFLLTYRPESVGPARGAVT